MKVIRLDSCEFCPYKTTIKYFKKNHGGEISLWICSKLDVEIGPPYNKIPNWCKLESEGRDE